MRWEVFIISVALLLNFGLPTAAEAGNGYGPRCVPEQSGDCSPWQRGPEAVKIATLKECPAPATWGYDLPYTFAYGTGIPYYTGHNYGAPSGAIYENPGTYPYGVPEPGVINGDPEYAMLVNYGYAFPFHGPTYFLRSGPLCGSLASPFAFTG